VPTEKTLRMQYFAAFRERAGLGGEELHSTASTLAQLYEEVALRHGFSFDRSILRAVLNDTIVPWTAEVRDGDRVAFLTPFAGG